MNNSLLGSAFGLIGLIGTTLVSVWALFKYVILGNYRLNGDSSKRFIDLINKSKSFKWILSQEYVKDPKYPDLYDAIVYMSGMFMRLSRAERLMTAGWKSKEDVTFLTFFRWNKAKIEKMLSFGGEGDVVSVSALGPGWLERLGDVELDKNAEIYIDSNLYADIEDEVIEVCEGKKPKTGMLLYGSPGNGKTQFIKYLSKKYALPINVIYLNPGYSNYEIARMFAEIPRRCIVLLEDFDNYFDLRECAMKNDRVNFTFDSIINALDGVHNDYKGVVFAMTANDISRIDDALKARPSRFKFVREFGPPSTQTRMRILNDPLKVVETEGLSLDGVFAAKNASQGHM